MNTTKIKNYSAIPDWQVLSWFQPRFYTDYVVEATVLPDVCPAEIMPNGTMAIVKRNWLDSFAFREAIGDIGCAMSYARLPNFNLDDLRLGWNELFHKLRGLDRAVLGSGNHFIDACLNSAGELVILVHLGSRMNTTEKEAFNFQQDYHPYSEKATKNHLQIWKNVREIFGYYHDFVLLEHDAVETDGSFMIIRKGVTHSEPGQPILIASSAEDIITLGVATPLIQEVANSMSHGTGRLRSRGEAKEVAINQQAIRQRLIIPDALEDSRWKLEAPHHYRDSQEVLALVEPFFDVTDQLLPIAFMGGF